LKYTLLAIYTYNNSYIIQNNATIMATRHESPTKESILNDLASLCTQLAKFENVYNSSNTKNQQSSPTGSVGPTGPSNPTSTTTTTAPQTVVHEHHYHNTTYGTPWSLWSPWSPFFQSPSQTIINNNTFVNTSPTSGQRSSTNDDDENKKKKKQTDYSMVGVVGLAASAFVFTYVFAKDGSVQLELTQLPSAVQNVLYNTGKLQTDDAAFKNRVYDAVNKVNAWITRFTARSNKVFYNKVGACASTVGLFGSLFANSGFGLYTSLAGITGSGCYALWQYLTQDDNIANEQILFDQSVRALRNLVAFPGNSASVDDYGKRTTAFTVEETTSQQQQQQRQQQRQRSVSPSGERRTPSPLYPNLNDPPIVNPVVDHVVNPVFVQNEDGYFQMSH